MGDDTLSQLSKMNVARLDTFTNSLQDTQEASKFIDDMLKANQVAVSQEKLQSEAEDNSAMGIQIRTRKLETRKEVKSEKAKRVEESVLVRKDDADGLADGFSQRQGNREYRIDPRLLSQLAEDVGIGIHEDSNPHDLINFVNQRMTVDGQIPDAAIVDKAFEFLLETTRHQLATVKEPQQRERLEKIQQRIESAKFKHFENNASAIQVAQKVIGAVDAVVEITGQPVKETLGRCRDMVDNADNFFPTFLKLYKDKGYKAMMLESKTIITFVGGHLKRKNLENAELMQLARTARKVQGWLGVFRQAKVHIPTMESYLSLNGVLAA